MLLYMCMYIASDQFDQLIKSNVYEPLNKLCSFHTYMSFFHCDMKLGYQYIFVIQTLKKIYICIDYYSGCTPTRSRPAVKFYLQWIPCTSVRPSITSGKPITYVLRN